MVEAEKVLVRRRTRVRLKFKWTKFLRFLLLLTLMLLIFEMSWLYIANLFQKVIVAQWGTIEKGNWMEVLYLREERLIKAPASGRLDWQVKTGMRVPRDEIIAAVITDEDYFANHPELSVSSLQLYKKFQKLLQEETAQKLDLQRIINDIAKRTTRSETLDSGPDLELLKQEKERVLRTIEWIRPQLSQTRQELLPVLERMRFVIADQAGCFALETDDFESVLQPESVERLTAGDFERHYPLKKPGNRVEAGEVIGKLINPFKQLVAIKIDQTQLGKVTEGDIWRFKTKSGWKNAPIVYLKALSDRQAIVGVEMPLTDPDLAISRTAKLFVVYQRITGVTIPVQALFKRDEATLVRMVKGDGYREKTVQVLGSDGSKAVVAGIEVGTMIISR